MQSVMHASYGPIGDDAGIGDGEGLIQHDPPLSQRAVITDPMQPVGDMQIPPRMAQVTNGWQKLWQTV